MSHALAALRAAEARDQAVYEVVVACLPRGTRGGRRKAQLLAAWPARHPDTPCPTALAFNQSLQRLREQGRLFYDSRAGWTWQ